MISRSLLRLKLRPRALPIAGAVRNMGGGGDHHGPNLPPFARLKPFDTKIPLQVELVWDDGVAPETAIDFDGATASTKEVWMGVGLAAAFFLGIYQLVAFSDPEGSSPVAPRSAVLDHLEFRRDFGMISEEQYQEELAARENHHDE